MKSPCKRLLCLVLCLLMIVSCIPAAGAEDDATTQDYPDDLRISKAAATRDGEVSELAYNEDTIYYNKNVTLDEDGTYTIALNSFVTGAVTPQPVPMDIVLVLDQSASMTNIMTDIPSSVYTKYFSKLKGEAYSDISALSTLIYIQTIESEQDGETVTQLVYRRAKVERTADATAKGIFTQDGSTWQTDISYCSNSLTTANSKVISLDEYHYTPDQKNFVLKYNSSYGYYYQNASDSTEKTGYYSTAQEAFDYTRTTYQSENYSDYKVALYDNGDGTVHSDITFYIPIQYFRWVSPQYTITYYAYSDTEYATSLGQVIDRQVWTAETPTAPEGYQDEICRTDYLRYFTREDALQNAALDFIAKMQNIAATQGVEHRIAVAGFGNGKDGTNADGSQEGSGGAYLGTELLSTAEEVGYSSAVDADYKDALQLVNVDGKMNPRLETAIDRIEGNGATFLEYGLKMAKSILDAREDKNYTIGSRTLPRKTLVIVFTDGVPGYYDFDNYFADYTECGAVKCANRAITNAKALKDDGATVYCIGMLEDADPADSYSFTSTSFKAKSPLGVSTTYTGYTTKAQAINAFLHFLSSDYPNATNMTSENRTTVVNNGYFYAANTAEALDQAFINISETVAVSTVELTAKAVMRDVMAEGFDLPADIADNPRKYIATATLDYLGNEKWGPIVQTTEYPITVDAATKTVDVTGFDYEANYVHEEYTDSAGNIIPAGGKRLLIVIFGVTANDAAVQNSLVNTNDASSGIYVNGDLAAELVVAYNMPTEQLEEKSFVLDYFASSEINPEEVGVFTPKHLSKNGMGLIPSHIETYEAEDGTEKTKRVYDYCNELECANGTIKIVDGKLQYTPTTADFHAVDSFYLYGKDANGENVWAKLNIVPANNVFYEDDWVTYSANWSIVGTVGSNTETFNGGAHGYIDSKANESGYSNGSAHFSDYEYATAEFSFTGTGIDVYCRTDSECGVALAVLNSVGETVTSQNLVMDVLSTSGTYYQIPALFFHDLPYDTYTLKITIKNAVYDGGRDDFYLDGFRVYNPLETEDEIVTAAYGNEADSSYATLRELLINASETTGSIEGAVFIDDTNEDQNVNAPDDNSSSIQDYIDYGPKNEIYLAPGNSIILKVDTAAHYYLGIKSPTGSATVSYSSGTNADGEDLRTETTINSAADLYYEVIPSADGFIEIKNISGGIIALTKLRSCSGTEKGLNLRSATAEEILAYANSFDSLVQAETPTIGAPTYTKAPKQPKPIFRNIKKPILGREQR